MAWPDGVWMEFSYCGFKSHSGQLSVATSENPELVNTIYIKLYMYIVIYKSGAQ